MTALEEFEFSTLLSVYELARPITIYISVDEIASRFSSLGDHTLMDTLGSLQKKKMIKVTAASKSTHVRLTVKGIDELYSKKIFDAYVAGELCEQLNSESAFRRAIFYYSESGRLATGSGEGLASIAAIEALLKKCKERGIDL